MDGDTLTCLLRHGHLNMPDRISRGLWPHPPIPFEEVVEHLAHLLRSEEWFPWRFRPAVAGEPVQDGGVIERRSDTCWIYHYQRPHAVHPCVLAEQGKKPFSSAEAAARHYLKWDLYLPGDLDGWRVVG